MDDDFKQSELLRKRYEKVFSSPNTTMKAIEEFFDENEEELNDVARHVTIHFDREDILEAIDPLSNYAAAGSDGFPAVLLKMYKHELAEPLELL